MRVAVRLFGAVREAVGEKEPSVELPDGAAQELAGALVDLVVTLGLVGVAIGRVRARGPIV